MMHYVTYHVGWDKGSRNVETNENNFVGNGALLSSSR